MKIIITENVKKLIEDIVVENIISEDLNSYSMNPTQIMDKLKRYAAIGLLSLGMLNSFVHQYKLTNDQANEVKEVMVAAKEKSKQPIWKLVTKNAIGTVYNSHPSQCKSDCSTTANNFRLNLKNPAGHRIVAIERSMEKKWGIKQGDVIKVEGAGDLDGVWQVQDRMNKRFAGLPKIDFLVDYKRKTGKWDNLKIYKLRNPKDKVMFMKKFAPQAPIKKNTKKRKS